MGYSMLKLSLQKDNGGPIELIAGEDKRVHNFLKGISPKVNTIARMGFERTYNEVTVPQVFYYVM